MGTIIYHFTILGLIAIIIYQQLKTKNNEQTLQKQRKPSAQNPRKPRRNKVVTEIPTLDRQIPFNE